MHRCERKKKEKREGCERSCRGGARCAVRGVCVGAGAGARCGCAVRGIGGEGADIIISYTSMYRVSRG